VRFDREIEPDAMLPGFGAWLHAHFHDALSDRGAVTKLGQMTN
jgi:hypothetical protein